MKIKKAKAIKNLMRSVAFVIAVALLTVAVINIYLVLAARPSVCSPDEITAADVDCIMVLGAGVRSDGTPSLMLQDRLNTAIELYNSGVCDRILMSGDHGTKYYNEVEAMKSYAVKRGVDPNKIFLDHAGFSTYESMYRAGEIFKAESLIIVTQKYHLYRAVYDAEKLGLNAYGVYCDGDNYQGQFYRDLREAVARVKDFIITLYKPLPKYLGEAIPVQGSNGNITDGGAYA